MQPLDGTLKGTNLFTSENPDFESFVEKLARLLKTDPSALLESDLVAIPAYDSLGKIEVAMLVEEELGCLLSQDELARCRTARQVFDAATNSQA